MDAPCVPILANSQKLVYLDFKPKIPGQGYSTVNYKVETCE